MRDRDAGLASHPCRPGGALQDDRPTVDGFGPLLERVLEVKPRLREGKLSLGDGRGSE